MSRDFFINRKPSATNCGYKNNVKTLILHIKLKNMKKIVLSLAAVFMAAIAGNQLSAQILQGTTTVSAANNMAITVTVNTNTNMVDITTTGPNGVWFGYGFGGSSMTNRYTHITEGSGSLTERKLGNHTSGSLLAASILSSSTAVNAGVRTNMISQNRVGSSSDYFTFPNTPGSFVIIWAKGNGSSLSQHSSSNRGSSMITLVDVCNIPTTVLNSVSACGGDSVMIFGEYKSAAGVYLDTMATALGCDSVLSQELIINAIDTSVTAISNGLTANHAGANATFEWIDCFTNIVVAGQTSQTLMAPTSSEYRVVITDGGCVDSSACKNVTLFSIDEFALTGVKMYPNPATSTISVELQNAAPHQISVFNSFGQKLMDEVSSQTKTALSISNLPIGVYFVEVVQGNKVFRQKIVKQ